MAVVSKVAKRYAKSLLDLALEQKKADQVMGDMKMIYGLCNESREFTAFLESPIIQTRKKLKAIEAIFEGKVDKLSLGFINLLAKNKRENILENIALGFMDQYKKHKGVLEVFVESVKPLEQETKDTIVEKVKAHFDGTIELHESTNPDLIGGFVVSVEDKQIDASVKDQLLDLKNLLLN